MLELGSWEDVSGVFRVFWLRSRESCDVSVVLGVLSYEVFSISRHLQASVYSFRVLHVFGQCYGQSLRKFWET